MTTPYTPGTTPARDPIERAINGTLELAALAAIYAIQATYNLRDRLTVLGAAVAMANAEVRRLRAVETDHDENCVPTEQDVLALLGQRDALRSVVRHWEKCIRRDDDPPMSEWDDVDWHESDWTPAEAVAIRNALDAECPECGQYGACAYDTEGRPLIHVTEDSEEQ